MEFAEATALHQMLPLSELPITVISDNGHLFRHYPLLNGHPVANQNQVFTQTMV